MWTGSFILVVLVHAVRDIEITYLDYCVKAEELGDEQRALHEIEHLNHWRRRAEKT